MIVARSDQQAGTGRPRRAWPPGSRRARRTRSGRRMFASAIIPASRKMTLRSIASNASSWVDDARDDHQRDRPASAATVLSIRSVAISEYVPTKMIPAIQASIRRRQASSRPAGPGRPTRARDGPAVPPRAPRRSGPRAPAGRGSRSDARRVDDVQARQRARPCILRNASLRVRSPVIDAGGSRISPIVCASSACANRPTSAMSPCPRRRPRGRRGRRQPRRGCSDRHDPGQRVPSGSTTPMIRVEGAALRTASHREDPHPPGRAAARWPGGPGSRRRWCDGRVEAPGHQSRLPRAATTRDARPSSRRPSTRLRPRTGGALVRSSSPLRAVLPDVDALHDPESDRQAHERRAAVA